MNLMVYGSALGLILFFINLVFSGLESRNHAKDKEVLEQEINALKAKMFDLQEATSVARHESKAVIETADDDDDSDDDN